MSIKNKIQSLIYRMGSSLAYYDRINSSAHHFGPSNAGPCPRDKSKQTAWLIATATSRKELSVEEARFNATVYKLSYDIQELNKQIEYESILLNNAKSNCINTSRRMVG